MGRLMTAADFLQAFSEGLIGTRDAMRGIGVNSSSGLLNAMADCRWRPPSGRDRREAEHEMAEAPGLPI